MSTITNKKQTNSQMRKINYMFAAMLATVVMLVFISNVALAGITDTLVDDINKNGSIVPTKPSNLEKPIDGITSSALKQLEMTKGKLEQHLKDHFNGKKEMSKASLARYNMIIDRINRHEQMLASSAVGGKIKARLDEVHAKSKNGFDAINDPSLNDKMRQRINQFQGTVNQSVSDVIAGDDIYVGVHEQSLKASMKTTGTATLMGTPFSK